MKRLSSFILLIIFGFCISGCYDDSKLKEDISDLQKRVSALELLCSQMNTNIVGMQTIVNSLSENDCITSVTPVKDGDDIIGYTIDFLKASPITIYNGTNGVTPPRLV